MTVLSFRIERSAQASWQGTLAEGSGRLALGSGAVTGSYSLRSRGAYHITRIELHTAGDVRGLDAASFNDLAHRAKDCTVARAPAGMEITLEASVASD